MSEVAVKTPAQELVDAFKLQGMDIAEEAVKVIVNVVFDFAQKQIIASENKYDDMLLAFLPRVKDEVLKLCDKVDGKVG